MEDIVIRELDAQDTSYLLDISRDLINCMEENSRVYIRPVFISYQGKDVYIFKDGDYIYCYFIKENNKLNKVVLEIDDENNIIQIMFRNYLCYIEDKNVYLENVKEGIFHEINVMNFPCYEKNSRLIYSITDINNKIFYNYLYGCNIYNNNYIFQDYLTKPIGISCKKGLINQTYLMARYEYHPLIYYFHELKGKTFKEIIEDFDYDNEFYYRYLMAYTKNYSYQELKNKLNLPELKDELFKIYNKEEPKIELLRTIVSNYLEYEDSKVFKRIRAIITKN